jgi:cytoskeletal protein RodZ
VTGKRRADARHASRPWHERTPLVVGASIGVLIVIGLLYFAVSAVAPNYDQPPRLPAQYIEPTNTVTTAGTATTTASTITSTVPPQTSEIDNPTSGTSTSDTSTTTTTTSVSITQSRRNHYGGDPRWPYPLPPSAHTTVLPQH